uniref:Uncharacterized protein n=1 Tax=Oryza sativa subsp. japonica TaxID=39947 RepID=Q653B7_ORYSJ|nr:hypothetical protein [Oryza sativa Japonica Group]
MKGINSFTVAVGENIFWSGPCLLQVHFSDMHSLYRRKRLDANLIAIWCLMNYVEAEAMKKPVAYLNPCMISKPNHTYTLDEKKLPEHIKVMTPEERKAYIAQKHLEKMLDVATYVAIALESMQDKECVYAPYAFDDQWIVFLLYPKYNEVIVLDSLDKDSNTYQEFLRIIDLAFKRYYQRGEQRKNSRERIFVRNKWPCHKQPVGIVLCGYYCSEFLRVNGKYCANYDELPKFPKSERELNDTSIQNIQADMCYFIHRECAHQLGRFFDNEGVLALPENESLSNWTIRII